MRSKKTEADQSCFILSVGQRKDHSAAEFGFLHLANQIKGSLIDWLVGQEGEKNYCDDGSHGTLKDRGSCKQSRGGRQIDIPHTLSM